MLAFRDESLASFEPEARGLVGRYLREVTTVFEDRINWRHYRKLETEGLFKSVTVRDEAMLVGFVSLIIYNHPNASATRLAHEVGIYLLPAYRKGMTGARLVREAERLAKAHGADYLVITARPGSVNLGPLLALRQFKQFETPYIKRLNNADHSSDHC